MYDMSLLNMNRMSSDYTTDSPIAYADWVGTTTIGNLLGKNSLHSIQPGYVHHNIFVCLIGESTLSRKTTAQNRGQRLVPQDRVFPRTFSPESLEQEICERKRGIMFLPEMSYLTKMIYNRGYGARLSEVFNELRTCQPIHRKLTKKKDEENEWICDEPNVSAVTTITPDVLKTQATKEMSEGGFLPRWELVGGVPRYRKRDWLRSDVAKADTRIKRCYELLAKMGDSDKKTYFKLEKPSAMDCYNDIEAFARKAYAPVGPFVGRYMDDIVAVADILYISDVFGKLFSCGKDFDNFGNLETIVELVEYARTIKPMATMEDNNPFLISKLDELNELDRLDGLDKLDTKIESMERIESIEPVESSKPNAGESEDNAIMVGKEYVESAWGMIEPNLKVAMDLRHYVDVEKPVADLRAFIQKYGLRSYSECMRGIKASAKVFPNAVMTLRDWDEIMYADKDGNELEDQKTIEKGMCLKWIGDKAGF